MKDCDRQAHFEVLLLKVDSNKSKMSGYKLLVQNKVIIVNDKEKQKKSCQPSYYITKV